MRGGVKVPNMISFKLLRSRSFLGLVGISNLLACSAGSNEASSSQPVSGQPVSAAQEDGECVYGIGGAWHFKNTQPLPIRKAAGAGIAISASSRPAASAGDETNPGGVKDNDVEAAALAAALDEQFTKCANGAASASGQTPESDPIFSTILAPKRNEFIADSSNTKFAYRLPPDSYTNVQTQLWQGLGKAFHNIYKSEVTTSPGGPACAFGGQISGKGEDRSNCNTWSAAQPSPVTDDYGFYLVYTYETPTTIVSVGVYTPFFFGYRVNLPLVSQSAEPLAL